MHGKERKERETWALWAQIQVRAAAGRKIDERFITDGPLASTLQEMVMYSRNSKDGGGDGSAGEHRDLVRGAGNVPSRETGGGGQRLSSLLLGSQGYPDK